MTIVTKEHAETHRGLVILAALLLVAAVVIFSRPPIGQPAAYHDFADQRAFLGVPNFLDVASNLPFPFVGAWGLLVVFGHQSSTAFLTRAERWPYAFFFFGVALTFFGSSYYHLHPDNSTLVWDRLPMTLAFMGILAATIAERTTARAGVLWLPPLLAAGAGSVLYWNWSEAHGQGDLRAYLLVQFGSLLAVLAMLILFRPRYTETWCVVVGLALYAGAKLLESLDRQIYALGGLVSGHTLKHLVAAGAAYFILTMLRRRTLITGTGGLPLPNPKLKCAGLP
jgi:hypothetical protein